MLCVYSRSIRFWDSIVSILDVCFIFLHLHLALGSHSVLSCSKFMHDPISLGVWRLYRQLEYVFANLSFALIMVSLAQLLLNRNRFSNCVGLASKQNVLMLPKVYHEEVNHTHTPGGPQQFTYIISVCSLRVAMSEINLLGNEVKISQRLGL